MLTSGVVAIVVISIIILIGLVFIVIYLYQESEKTKNVVVPPVNNNCIRSTDTIPDITGVDKCFNSTDEQVPYRRVDSKTIKLASGAILSNVSSSYLSACRSYCKGDVVNGQCTGGNQTEYNDCIALTKPVDGCTGPAMPIAYASDIGKLAYWYLYSIPPGPCAET